MSGFVFNEKPIQVARGDGAYVYDDSGTEYLDMGASYACVPLGHGHEAVQSAVADQLEQITYVQASYPNAERTALYDLLADTAPDPIDRTWLCNSGTEANEAALKFARSATGNSKIVATMQGFHGRTMGALATTWKNKYKKPYEPLIGDVEFVPYDDADALDEAVDEDTAAFIENRSRARVASTLPRTATSKRPAKSPTKRVRPSSSTRSRPGWAAPARCGTPSGPWSRPT